MQWEPIIGLEIHVELLTKTKLFCGCLNGFGENPNTQVCPVCLGLPGVLPAVNEEAVRLLVKAALAFQCEIPRKSKFDRKNYFYPDMPKNYQISQYDLPFALHGQVSIPSGEAEKKIRLERIHLEEDTGKTIHVAPGQTVASNGEAIVGGRIGRSSFTLLDYNRAGIPLIEIVTEPDLRSEKEAVDFLQKLRLTLQVLGVSDCKMEEGQMRCDANVSLRPRGEEKLGAKVEIKNMNSFKSVREALSHEIERQEQSLARGERLTQETRGWDEGKRVTFSMRSKEDAHDYRYFPEPDLPPFALAETWVSEIRASLPELPEEKWKRYRESFGLSQEEAEVITQNLSLAGFFEESIRLLEKPKEICNWIRGEILQYLNEAGKEISGTQLTPEKFIGLLQLMEAGTISGKIAKEILPEMLRNGKTAGELVEACGLTQISDRESLRAMVLEILSGEAGLKAVQEYQSGKARALDFLVGAVMKKTKGKANPQLLQEILKESLEDLKKLV